ncbi:hypothetical protein BN1723_002472 [Verticillium longisporum]|uniref:Uncharacterized protein n=1 Tax=Verticillium longisporum TaxID=100787 RepID=A0A0G4L8I1_VERLO|nr:hypothetical protein BN1723_002472 [Verticillium longisporum]
MLRQDDHLARNPSELMSDPPRALALSTQALKPSSRPRSPSAKLSSVSCLVVIRLPLIHVAPSPWRCMASLCFSLSTIYPSSLTRSPAPTGPIPLGTPCTMASTASTCHAKQPMSAEHRAQSTEHRAQSTEHRAQAGKK